MFVSSRASFLALVALAALSTVGANAQSKTYKDPTGTYSVTVAMALYVPWST